MTLETGELRTTPMAPWHSTSWARVTVLTPRVVPPPTPQNTGMLEALMIASLMDCCGVNGYTAKTASALQFLITARSVVYTRVRILRPKMTMPLASHAAWGILSILCLSLASKMGACLFTTGATLVSVSSAIMEPPLFRRPRTPGDQPSQLFPSVDSIFHGWR